MRKKKRPKTRQLRTHIKITHEATATLKRQKYERIDDALRDKARELVNAGVSKHQVARTLRISRQAVQDITRDIESTPRRKRARAELVDEVMGRFKDFYSLMIRLRVPPRHLSVIAHWMREKAGREDDVTLETLVDDRQAFLSWFLEVLAHDSDFLDRHQELRGFTLTSAEGENAIEHKLPDGRTIRLVLTRSEEEEQPLALPAPKPLDEEEPTG